MAMSNDDAIVDCIVYSNECRSTNTEPIPMRNGVEIEKDDTRECSVTMCGNDGPLLKYCENGHYIHVSCLEFIFLAAETLSVTVCPQCRSDRMLKLVKKMMPMTRIDFSLAFSSTTTAKKAIDCASKDFFKYRPDFF